MILKNKSDCNLKNRILSISNQTLLNIFVISLSLTFSFLILESHFNKANAVGSLEQTIQNFNNNLQSNIGKQIQSNLNQGAQQPSTNDNIIDCGDNGNVINQFRISNNGHTSSINDPSCNGPSSSLSSGDPQR
jgi:hypothetical protein